MTLQDAIARIPPSQRYEVAEAIERACSPRTVELECGDAGVIHRVSEPGLTGPAAHVVEALLDALRAP